MGRDYTKGYQKLTTNIFYLSFTCNVNLEEEKKEQERVRDLTLLPRKMIPSVDVFKSLGFSFAKTDDKLLYKATLPKGWCLKENEHLYYTDILDEKGRIRAKSVYVGVSTNRDGYLRLFNRYSIMYRPLNDCINVTAADYDFNILFDAGTTESRFFGIEALEEKAKQYLDKNFPEWENPLKYWD